MSCGVVTLISKCISCHADIGMPGDPPKSCKTMGVCLDSYLTCRLTALEAQAAGLVSRVVYTDQLMAEARSMAARIASLSALAVAKAKDCINRAYEVPLSEGLRYEQ